MADRFLLIRLSAAGDVIHALPVAAALRDAFPAARIAWAVEGGPAELLADNPDVDELILLDPPSWQAARNGSRWGDVLKGLARVRRGAFDVALDAQGLIKSGLLALWSGAPLRLGFEHRACKEGLNVAFTTHQVPLPPGPHHVVEKNLKLLEPLGVRAPRIRFPLPRREEDEEYISSFLREAGLGSVRRAEDAGLAALHPWAGWETKRWGEERYAALADRLAEAGARVVLTWGPGEEEACRRVAEAMRRAALIAPPTTWRQLASLLRRVRLFVGGDTGPLHLAAALGVPCLALMGPTNPARNGPFGRSHSVLHRRLWCSDCYGRTCPDIECLRSIGPDLAAREALAIWERVGGT